MSESEVIVFHSIEHHATPTGIFMAPSFGIQNSVIYSNSDPDIKRINEVYEKNAQLILDRAKGMFLEQGIEVETQLVYDSDPVSYIKEVVEKEHIDLVIIGAKGTHSLIKEILIGSVADKVLRHVPCDVLVIK